MFSWYPVMDLARAPRRAARKKGSGYENECKPADSLWNTKRTKISGLGTRMDPEIKADPAQ